MKKTTRLRPTDSTNTPFSLSLSLSSLPPPPFRYKFNYRLKYAPSLLMRPINSARKPRILDSKETLRGRDNEPPSQLLPIRVVSKVLRKAGILFYARIKARMEKRFPLNEGTSQGDPLKVSPFFFFFFFPTSGFSERLNLRRRLISTKRRSSD